MSIQHHSNQQHHTFTSDEVNLMGEVPSVGYIPLYVEDNFLHEWVSGIMEQDLHEWEIKPMNGHVMKKPTLWEILNTPIHLLW